MAPVAAAVFAPYRFWQLGRALWLLNLEPAAPAWLGWVVTGLLAFWVFDYGVTACLLPWIFIEQVMHMPKPKKGGGGKEKE